MKQDFTLEIQHLSKSYHRGKKEILKDINVSIKNGACVGILGANGSGKSTLLSILAGITTPTLGSFQVAHSTDATHATTNIGYIPQENPLMEELSALDNLRLWYSLSETSLEDELANGTLHELGIHDFLKTKVKYMSGGMKKRLSIGCSLAKSPNILLLDEPGAALDLPCKETILHCLQSYKAKGNLAIIATHEEAEIEICDQLFLLQDGTLLPFSYDGNLDTIVNAIQKGVSQ